MRRTVGAGSGAAIAVAVAMGVGAVAAACSSSNSSGGVTSDAGATGDGAGPPANAGCVDACNAAAASHACTAADGGSLAFDAAKCALACSCVTGVMRDDLVEPYGVCIGTPSHCSDGGQDHCIADVAQPYVNDPAASDFRTACLARRSECADAGHSFTDDYCGQGVLLNTATLSAWNACLSQDCANIRTCLDQPFSRPGCN